MSGMTKKSCAALENGIAAMINPVLGAPQEDCGSHVWLMPHNTGTVIISLQRDSLLSGHVHRASWLACRLMDDKYRNKACPSPFGISGKHNFHPNHNASVDDLIYQAALHLESMCDEQHKGKFLPVCVAE